MKIAKYVMMGVKKLIIAISTVVQSEQFVSHIEDRYSSWVHILFGINSNSEYPFFYFLRNILVDISGE